MEINEQEILARCRNGELQHFGVLYDVYANKIYTFIYYKTMHRETAEDLTSQTFFKALSAISKFDPAKGSFSSWLYRIARNNVIDHYRSAKHTVDLEQIWDASDKTDMVQNADLKRQIENVRKQLLKFSEAQREIIIMRLWDELSYKEISQITGKSEASCKVAFSRAIAKLRKDLGPLALILLFLTITSYEKLH